LLFSECCGSFQPRHREHAPRRGHASGTHTSRILPGIWPEFHTHTHTHTHTHSHTHTHTHKHHTQTHSYFCMELIVIVDKVGREHSGIGEHLSGYRVCL